MKHLVRLPIEYSEILTTHKNVNVFLYLSDTMNFKIVLVKAISFINVELALSLLTYLNEP